MDKRILAGSCAGLIAVAVVGYFVWGGDSATQQAAAPEAGAAKPGVLTADQLKRLGIVTELARDAGALPLGTVSALVSLPPEARVAVTAPFAGTAVQLLVIQGQQVERGQPLAVVRAAEAVQYGADLARAQADLTMVEANANRLGQLAREGIVAGARADEANASLRRTQATIRENNRLLALAGAGRDGTITLRAPIAGRVASVAVETGGPVGGMTAPFVIENVSALTLDLQLPERLAARVRPGMAVEVALPAPDNGSAPDGAPDGAAEPVPVAGRILSRGASIDPMTRSVPAKASIAAAPGLVPGKGVMAIIKGDAMAGGNAAGGGISVPSRSVTRIEGQDYVFVRSGNAFSRRKVQVVADAAGRSIIAQGLKAGEAVATSGIAELKVMLAGQ